MILIESDSEIVNIRTMKVTIICVDETGHGDVLGGTCDVC
jgi:ribonuclease HIII